MEVAIGVVKSISMYLSLALMICVWRLGFAEVKAAARDPQSFADVFLRSGFWALLALLATVGLGMLLTSLKKKFNPDFYRPLSVAGSAFGGLGYAFKNPFDGLRAPWINKKYNDLTGGPWLASKAYSIIHFTWAVALILYVAVGLIAVAA